MPIARRLLQGAAAIAVLGPAYLLWQEPWLPMQPSEISARVTALLRYGAVEVPHEMAGPDHPQAALMARVAAGRRFDIR